MKNTSIFCLIFLASCTAATAPTYNPANIIQTSFVLFYDNQDPDDSNLINLHYNGKNCELHNKGFLVIPGSQADILAISNDSQEASRFSAGTTRTTYIRIDENKDVDTKAWRRHGPYKFAYIDDKQAQKELQGMQQNCL